jgi:TonB family protein
MRLTAFLGFTALLAASAHAECQRPVADVVIPEGATASEQALVAAAQKVRELDAKVAEYQSCLAGEASQKSVGKDETARQQILSEHAALHDAAVEELAMLAVCLQAQVAEFRSSGGGAENKPADCSAFKGQQPKFSGPPRSDDSNWVTEADGYSFELPGGVWSYSLLRDDTPRACGANNDQECFVRMVFVRNGSDQVLECKGMITYAGTDIGGKRSVELRALVPEKSMRGILVSAAERSVSASTFDADCTPRAPLPPLEHGGQCKYEVVKPVPISDYYPEASRTNGEEGPVIVEFGLKNKPGHPTDVKVVASSLYPAIDAAAVRAVSDMIMTGSCKKARYRLQLTFKLQ